MKSLAKLCVGLTFLLCTSVSIARERARERGPFTPFEKNVEALNESVLMTTSMLVQQFGALPAAIKYSGTFSESDWSIVHMTGTYAGMPLNFSFTGTFNQSLNKGNFTSEGTHGTNTWSGSGIWRFTAERADSIRMFWDSGAEITLPSGEVLVLDKHFTQPKLWTKSMLDNFFSITDFGVYRSTLFGIPIPFTRQKEISDWIVPKNGPREAIVTYTLPDDSITLIGFADFDNHTVSGTITVSHNPTTIFKFGKGSETLSTSQTGDGKCNPGTTVVISVGISSGKAGNTINGTALCDSVPVAGPAVAKDLGSDVKKGIQVKGAAICNEAYTGVADDSTWSVTCNFY